MCCKNSPPVCVSQPHIGHAILGEARATIGYCCPSTKLENLQLGVFSEVRQKICQSPELSVLTSVTNNHPSCAAPQGCESRCPRAPVKGGPLFYSDRDRNARWPIPSSLSDIPRAPSQFVDLFQASQIEFVVDVRHIPRSRTNPQFNRETLAEELAMVQIGYAHVAALGGLRNRSRVDVSPNLFWDNLSFRNYADYAMTQEFHQGLRQLKDCGHDRCTAVMCAEAVWWRCHRRIIADYLIRAGEDVFHILNTNHVDQARLTPGAIPQPDGTIIYPARRSSALTG